MGARPRACRAARALAGLDDGEVIADEVDRGCADCVVDGRQAPRRYGRSFGSFTRACSTRAGASTDGRRRARHGQRTGPPTDPQPHRRTDERGSRRPTRGAPACRHERLAAHRKNVRSVDSVLGGRPRGSSPSRSGWPRSAAAFRCDLPPAHSATSCAFFGGGSSGRESWRPRRGRGDGHGRRNPSLR